MIIGTLLLGGVVRAYARESPTITIQNQSSEPVLARLAGPTAGFVSIPAGGSRIVLSEWVRGRGLAVTPSRNEDVRTGSERERGYGTNLWPPALSLHSECREEVAAG